MFPEKTRNANTISSEPQDLRSGKQVRLRQAEDLRAAIDHDLNILRDVSHMFSFFLPELFSSVFV